MLVAALIMMAKPLEGYRIVVVFLSLYFAFMGLKHLVNFFTLARFMVGGRLILFEGVVLLDFGLLSASLTDVPRGYIMLYLIAVHAFSGVVEILRAREAKSYGSGRWRFKITHGIVNILMAIACIAYIKKPAAVVVIYAMGLAYSALMWIISGLRKNTMIYIQ